MRFLPVRWDIWSTEVAEIQGNFLEPLSERQIFALISRPLEWRKEHIYTQADPFMLVAAGRLWLFVEKQSRGTSGVVCAYSSQDLSTWCDHGTVLQEPFHLSYPQVVAANGFYWMLPEAVGSGAVWLYRAAALPGPWQRQRRLLASPHADPTLLFSDNRWYMWATDAVGKLRLYHSDAIDGPYAEHPCSPVTDDARYARCGGRPIQSEDGNWLRLAQDGLGGYGKAIHAMMIVELTPSRYKETNWRSDVLGHSRPWNSGGSHHLDAVEYLGRRIRAIDGKRPESLFNLVSRLFWRAVSRVASL